jgi:hypothetical protein
MTKEEAQKILQGYINDQIEKNWTFLLPKKDVIIFFNDKGNYNGFTWTHLIQIAYPN